MFTYNIAANASNAKFKEACDKIENSGIDIAKEPKLVDVDGSEIQIYTKGKLKVKVYNDFEVDAVYIDSEIDLNKIFN